MKKYILRSLCVAAIGLFASCNSFLDVSPKDKVLEEDQFSTEAGIQGALNGLYRQMIANSLYGATMSQTTLEAMGHVYTYPPTQPSGSKLSLTLYNLCSGQYTNSTVEGTFSSLWKSGYTTLFNINFFLKSMSETSALISQDHKDMIMGEAYGLRAYLHFDLFRIFGPRWEERSETAKILPYNNSTDVVLNHTGYEEDVYVTADTYINNVLKDIESAEQLLKADPIISDNEAITSELKSDFYKNRNRRMNYFAVKALKARVLQYLGRSAEAAASAKEVTDNVGSVFKWTDVNQVVSKMNYSFFSEVIFGINSPDMSSNYTSFYSKTALEDLYAVDHDNLLQNIYESSADNLKSIVDVRAQQWTESNDLGSAYTSYSQNGTYISNKFNMSTNTYLPALVDFQPLMRITEMYYIQAENALKEGDKATAAQILNTIASKRGIPDTSSYYLSENDDESVFYSHIEREYYKEFYGEGQIFFYHKRKKSTEMFPGYGGIAVSVNPSAIYNIPIPKSETDI